MPHEVVVKYVVPNLKALMALNLSEHGFGQVKTAKLLGTSQTMVNKYMRYPKSHYLKKLLEVGLSKEIVNNVIKMLENALNEGGSELFIKAFTSAINYVISQGTLCKLHRQLYSKLPLTCTLCQDFFTAEILDPYIAEVKQAVEQLVKHKKSYELIPEVGMNIALAPPNAQTAEDVVAIPGRIMRVGFTVKPMSPPSYGGSYHLSIVLLKVRSIGINVKAAINIRFKEEFLKKLKKNNFHLTNLGPHKKPEDFMPNLEKLLKTLRKRVDAIVDLGGQHLEPVIYVFGNSASDVVKKAFTVLD
ncbi:MAG: thiamine-phosphate synthase family protein [Candidatus Bathyarchaeota archaeon]